MAFLNQSQRDSLRQELLQLNYNQMKGKLNQIDAKGRLAYIRNVQGVDKWMTRFELVGLGTRVTIIETFAEKTKLNGKIMSDYAMVDVVVEARPDNKA